LRIETLSVDVRGELLLLLLLRLGIMGSINPIKRWQ